MTRWRALVFTVALASAGCGARSTLDDGPTLACPPEEPVAVRLAGQEHRLLTDLAADGKGRIVTAAYSYDEKPIPDGEIFSAHNRIVLTTLDGAGSVVHERSYRVTEIAGGCVCGALVAPRIAADSRGDVVLAMGFPGHVDLGPGGMDGRGAVAKLGPSGEVIWRASLSAPDIRFVRPAIDARGDVVVAGQFTGTLTWAGVPAGAAAGEGSDVFLVKVDTAGHVVWAKTFAFDAPGLTEGPIAGVFAAPSGDVLLTGRVSRPVDFGGGPVGITDHPASYGARFDGAGHHVWSRRYPPQELFSASDLVAVGPAGDLVFAFPADTDQLKVIRLDGSGDVAWHRTIEGAPFLDPVPAVDATGAVLLVGRLAHAAALSPGAPDGGLYAVALGPGGDLRSRSVFGGPHAGAFRPALRAVFDACGSPWIGGTFSGSIELGGETLRTTGGSGREATFVARIQR